MWILQPESKRWRRKQTFKGKDGQSPRHSICILICILTPFSDLIDVFSTLPEQKYDLWLPANRKLKQMGQMRKCEQRWEETTATTLFLIPTSRGKMVVQVRWIKGLFHLMLLLQAAGEDVDQVGRVVMIRWILIDMIVWRQLEPHSWSEKETKPCWPAATSKRIRQNAKVQPGFSLLPVPEQPWNWSHWDVSGKSGSSEFHCQRTVLCWSRRSELRTPEFTPVGSSDQGSNSSQMPPCTYPWLPVSTDTTIWPTTDKHRTEAFSLCLSDNCNQ